MQALMIPTLEHNVSQPRTQRNSWGMRRFTRAERTAAIWIHLRPRRIRSGRNDREQSLTLQDPPHYLFARNNGAFQRLQALEKSLPFPEDHGELA